MPVKTIESRAARESWRDTLDLATTGQADVVITRYGKPVTAMIRYADYAKLRAELQRLRAAQQESYQTMVASEAALAAEWDSAEEDEAWQDL